MKKTQILLTRSEVEQLVRLVSDKHWQLVAAGLKGPVAYQSLSRKAWSAYADTHPEEGPFQ